MGANGNWREIGINIKCFQFDKIDKEKFNDEHFDWICIAYDASGEEIAFAKFSEVGKYLVPYNTEVSRDFRRLGIASAMYDLAQKLSDKEISPDEDQTPDAIEFWKSR